jgi:UDP-glucose 4-epimerase
VDAALRGEPLPINGDGSTSRDFTYVGTVTSLLTRAVLDRTVSSPTNLAFGSRTSLLELVTLIEGILGHFVEREHRDSRPGDVRHSQANNDLLRSLFPDVQPTPLDEGLGHTIAWMRGSLLDASVD